jgi:hypothetical protein
MKEGGNLVRAMKVLLVSIVMVAMFSSAALANDDDDDRAAFLELPVPLGAELEAGFAGGPFLFVGE